MDKITQLLKQMHEMAEYSGDSPKPLGDFLYEGMLTPGYEAEFLKDPAIKTEDITDADKIKRADPYQNFAKPVVPSTDPQTALELRKRGITNYRVPDTVDNKMAGRPEYENVFADQGPQVQMNVGGRVAQAGSTLTPDEYQENLVDFYNFGGIEVKAAPAADPADPDPDPDPGPRIIPVDYQDHQEENAIFTAYDPVFGGNSRPDSNRYFSTQNYDDYIVDYDLTQPRDKSGNDEFSNFIGDMLPAGGGLNPDQPAKPDLISQFFGGALGTMASTITAKINRDNAAKIAATGGTSGSMYKFKGRVLSRAPGSKITNGQLGGMDQATALRNDEINKRFIPGTMTFNSDNGTDGEGFTAVATQAGYALDPFGTYHSAQRREDGHMMQGGGRLREVEFRNKAEELGIDISGMTKQEFRDAALAHKQHVDGVMKGSIYYGGFFHKTRSMSRDSYNSALALRGKTSAQFIIDSIIPQYGLSTPTTPVTTTTSTTTPTQTVTPTGGSEPPPGFTPADDDSGATTVQTTPGGRPVYYDDSDEGYQTDPGGGSAGSSSQDFSAQAAAEAPYADEFNYRQGGRVGMQMGGTASKDPVQSTGFVDGPPQNYAKGTTVADTENHRVRVGSFVLNAPTTERLQKEGKLPKGPQKRKAAKGGKMMEVALSKGEYVIDVDDIGKFGGYDALNKENNKGKPEVERRQAAAQGGFLGGYSNGGNMTLPTPSPVRQRTAQKEEDIPLPNVPDSFRKKLIQFMKPIVDADKKPNRTQINNFIKNLDPKEQLAFLFLTETVSNSAPMVEMENLGEVVFNRVDSNYRDFSKLTNQEQVLLQHVDNNPKKSKQFTGLEPSTVFARAKEVVGGLAEPGLRKAYAASENVHSDDPDRASLRRLPYATVFYTKKDAPNQWMRKSKDLEYAGENGGHEYYRPISVSVEGAQEAAQKYRYTNINPEFP